MARPDKVAAVEQMTGEFTEANASVLTEYRGLTVTEMKELRRSLGTDVTYAVAKNTLAKIAATNAGVEELHEHLSGPTAIAFIHGDVADAAKKMRDFAKAHPFLVIKGGVLEGKILDADQVKKLADLESREVLLSKMAGAMKGSLTKAAGTFAAPLSKAARLLGALQTKAEADPSVIGGAGTPSETDQKSDDAAQDAVTDSAESADTTAETPAPEAADAAEETTDAASEE